ncbi:LIM-domain binding protein-domain-containing protein [Chytridium lagenaria]|nr:LIM-domain binding protein-domain-containing protein [Chytridium lagenaria]
MFSHQHPTIPMLHQPMQLLPQGIQPAQLQWHLQRCLHDHRRASLTGDIVTIENTRKQAVLLRSILSRLGESPHQTPTMRTQDPTYTMLPPPPHSDLHPGTLPESMADAAVLTTSISANSFFQDGNSRLYPNHGQHTSSLADATAGQVLAAAAEKPNHGQGDYCAQLVHGEMANGGVPPPPPPVVQTKRRDSTTSLSASIHSKEDLMNRTNVVEDKQRYHSAISRLHSFLEFMSPTSDKWLNLDYWRSFASEFFSVEGFMTFKLFAASREQKRFDLPRSIIPRHFLILYDCGITKIEMCLNRLKEVSISPGIGLDGEKVTLIHHFSNGTKVISEGTLTIRFTDTFKLDLFEYVSETFSELLPRDTLVHFIQRTPTLVNAFKQSMMASMQAKLNDIYGGTTGIMGLEGVLDEKSFEGFKTCFGQSVVGDSVVNHFGVPVRTMRCFEITEMVGLMQDLIGRSLESQKGPLGT